MGSIPYCVCIKKRKNKLLESEIIIKKYDNYTNDVNLSNEERKHHNYIIKNLDYDLNKSSLTPQNEFGNPLPNIVILKHKKL